MDEFRNGETALVLSSGGGRGAFECGAIEGLTEKYGPGWSPDILVGTSIGAMNAAVWAVGEIEGDGAGRVGKMWDEIRTRDMHRFWRVRPWNSILDRTAWEETLERYAPEDLLAKTNKRLYIVATDIQTGRPVIFTNERDSRKIHFERYEHITYQQVCAIKHKHLLASSAIPYVYPWVNVSLKVKASPESDCTECQDHRLWDGVLMYSSPLQPAIDAGAKRIWVVLLAPFHKQDNLPPPGCGILAKIGYLIDLATMATFVNDYKQMSDDQRKVFGCQIISPEKWLTLRDYLSYRKARVRKLRDWGRKAAQCACDRLEREKRWDLGELEPTRQ
jgi:NTE family protein